MMPPAGRAARTRQAGPALGTVPGGSNPRRQHPEVSSGRRSGSGHVARRVVVGCRGRGARGARFPCPRPHASGPRGNGRRPLGDWAPGPRGGRGGSDRRRRPRAGGVLVVGHSAGAGIAYGAVDARPDRVARAVYIGGFPTAAGDPLTEGFTAEHGEIPLPPWSDFQGGAGRTRRSGSGRVPAAGDPVSRGGHQRTAAARRRAPLRGAGHDDLHRVHERGAPGVGGGGGAPPVRELARIRSVEGTSISRPVTGPSSRGHRISPAPSRGRPRRRERRVTTGETPRLSDLAE